MSVIILFINHKDFFLSVLFFSLLFFSLSFLFPLFLSALNSVFHSSQIQTISRLKLSFVFNPACSVKKTPKAVSHSISSVCQQKGQKFDVMCAYVSVCVSTLVGKVVIRYLMNISLFRLTRSLIKI